MFLISTFTTFIYQPFFNILIFFYWGLGHITETPDMGVAVILLTLLIRFLLLPLSLANSRSEKQRREISTEIEKIEEQHISDPIMITKQKQMVIKKSKRILISEVITLFIQTAIALMLWKIFATGLNGGDFDLIYSFMPEVEKPFNLVFLGKFDLTHPHMSLNLIQSILIFVLETLSVYTSPYPHTRGEVVRLQLILPFVSFLIFMGLPAGKKLFVITTLVFSIILTFIKAVQRRFYDFREKAEKKEASVGQDQVLVETK